MTQDQPSRLDRLETLLADVGDVVLQNAEVTTNHGLTLTRIEVADLAKFVDGGDI